MLLDVPSDYPLAAPRVTFDTTVFHPNVHFGTGEVCLDVLKEQWSPVWTLASVMRAVQQLLGDPDASSPLNCDAGNLVRSGDARGFASLARYYHRLHALATASLQE